MWIFSIVSLSLVIALCLMGIWHDAFKDNLLQCLGMACLIIACTGRVHWVWQAEYVDPSWMLVHVSMALYALGTAWKVVLRHGRGSGWRLIAGFDQWMMARKTCTDTFDDRPHHHHP